MNTEERSFEKLIENIQEKDLENKAWRKLKAYFPDNYVALNFDRTRFSSGAEDMKYHAYVNLEPTSFSRGWIALVI